MFFAIITLLIAASPVLIIFIFSEITASKEGSKLNDNPRNISKALGWLFFIIISLLLIYIVVSEGNGLQWRQAFNFISYFFDFLK